MRTARWEEKQFPRHDAVLARLMDRLSAPADARHLLRLLPAARWSRGKEVDPVLAGLVNHPDDSVRQRAVEALGWRLRKREGDAEPLRKALQHRDPITQFLAAEGLAKAGRAEGLNVLLASIDFASDLDIRRRAVLALGELADERALDALLRLAGEDGHALQEAAAEAIGHLGRSPRAEEIFKLLERFAKGDTGVARRALQGLRWLDTRGRLAAHPAACGVDRRAPSAPPCVELLGHNDDPATRDLLLRLLAERRRPGGRRGGPGRCAAPLGRGLARARLRGAPERGSRVSGRLRRDRWTASATGASRAASSRSSRSAPTRCASRWRPASSTGPSCPSPRRGPPSTAPTRSPPGPPPASSAGPAPRRPTRGRRWRPR